MKKIIIAAAVIFTSGILTFCINQKGIQPTSAVVKQSFYDYKKELASGD